MQNGIKGTIANGYHSPQIDNINTILIDNKHTKKGGIKMIPSILAILAGLSWLLDETNLMRIRLYTGAIPDHTIRKSWKELIPNLRSIPNRLQPFWYKFPENMQPLCGLDWLENTMHVIPEYKFEFNAYGLHSTITLNAIENNDKLIKDIAEATLRPNKQERLALTAQRKQFKRSK